MVTHNLAPLQSSEELTLQRCFGAVPLLHLEFFFMFFLTCFAFIALFLKNYHRRAKWTA